MKKQAGIAAVCCCLLFFAFGFAIAETQTSQAVRPFAEGGAAALRAETEDRAPAVSFISYRASGSETLSYTVNLESETTTCTFILRNKDGGLIDREHKNRTPKMKKMTYSIDLREGVYTLTVIERDEMGQEVFSTEETFYFLTNASIVVGPAVQSRGMTVATVHGKKQFDWYPVLDWSTGEAVSARYRFRIVADAINNRKEDFDNFSDRVIVDETMSERWHLVDADLLPSGTYTVKVWAYDSGGSELEYWIMTLVVQAQWTIYDYDLITDLDFTPGEAITRQHATGEKAATLVAYDAVLPEAPQLPMTRLLMGGETLDISCSGARFTASVSGDTLTLYTSGAGAWQIRQSALRTLSKSGIRTLRLLDGNGKTRELSTSLAFTGRQYALLRARGLVSKDFLLTAEAEGWQVTADGKTFDLGADGALIPRKEEAEAAAEEEGAA